MDEFPKKIIQSIPWNFKNDAYDSMEEFSKDLVAYTEKVTDEDFDIELYKPILYSNKVVIQYMYYDKEGEEIEPDFLLEASNSTFFTIEELLFKVHNKVCEKLKEADNSYFEGFLLWEGENPNYPDLPLYFLLQGS